MKHLEKILERIFGQLARLLQNCLQQNLNKVCPIIPRQTDLGYWYDLRSEVNSTKR